jgi:hypothetical protein
MFNQWAFRSICIAFDFRTLFVRHRGMNEWVEFLRPFDSFPSFLPSFLLSSTYIYLPCYTLGSIFPSSRYSLNHPSPSVRPFVRSFRQQNSHLSLLQSLPALTSIHYATNIDCPQLRNPQPLNRPLFIHHLPRKRVRSPPAQFDALARAALDALHADRLRDAVLL